jgi:hypothetical protein
MNTSSHSPNPHPGQPPDPLAVALSKLEPAPHGFEWNSLMFAAGRASKERAVAFWRVATAVCAVAACAFAFAYCVHPRRVPVVVERQRVVYVDRAAEKPAEVQPPAPVPEPKPDVKPDPRPEESPTSPQSHGWVFDPPPASGAAARWLSVRNEVLTVGLGVLPDHGRKAPGPRER